MIQVESLSRYYGEHRAVHDVSFSIGSNTVVGFLGLNGAGKTTILKVLAGLLSPSAGTVRIDGVALDTAPVSFRARIGFLPEDPPLYEEMTVSEFLHYVGALRGMSPDRLSQRTLEVIDQCQLNGRANQVIGELSHGYRKRVGIAQAIIHQPKLIILDEPISGLDPVQIVEMRQVITGLAKGCTVLVSSHILSEISQTCDQILILKDGQLLASGTEKDLAKSLGDGLRLNLELTGDPDAIKALLSARPDVSDFTVQGIVGEGDKPRVQLQVNMDSDAREGLIAGLVGADFGIRRVDDAYDELEEIFLGLTGESR
jgi:ABC-2 type transport system ATP-binding protein